MIAPNDQPGPLDDTIGAQVAFTIAACGAAGLVAGGLLARWLYTHPAITIPAAGALAVLARRRHHGRPSACPRAGHHPHPFPARERSHG